MLFELFFFFLYRYIEIPSKDQQYDPEQDTIMQRVQLFVGGGGK